MSGQINRLSDGGRIDRSKPLRFTFNGKNHTGYAGDTLASALIANGVTLVGRSFKYHRARGIMTAGAEEPNALVQLETGGETQPNLRATQIELYDGLVAASVNAWPSVDFDVGYVNNFLGRFFPAGFYYKTFMWPKAGWHFYESIIRRAAGLGKAPDAPDPDRYERMNTHCDVLVVGGGPAGLAAALAAGRTGARVFLADEQNEFGGSLLAGKDSIDGKPGNAWVQEALAELGAMENVRLKTRTTVTGYFDHNFLIAGERVTDHYGPKAAPKDLPRQRLWRIRAKRVVLATGSLERPLLFSHNDVPGVMLAGAARTYVNRFGVAPGKRAVIVTNNGSAYRTALDLADAGVTIAAVVDLRKDPAGPLVDAVRAKGIDIRVNSAVVKANGTHRVKSADVQEFDDGGTALAWQPEKIECDVICMSGGWSPTVHLFSQSRGKLDFNEEMAIFAPGEGFADAVSAGAANGVFDLGAGLAEGYAAGGASAKAAGFGARGKAPAFKTETVDEGPLRTMWVIPSNDGPAHGRKHFLDHQNDVTAADVGLAAREGYVSVEHVKRYTTLGMGTDQGKTSNVPGLAILAEALDKPIPEVGTTTFRPPYTPLTFGTIAGRDVGYLADPARLTPMHQWHVDQGAIFEDVGQWKRPYVFPKNGESVHDAVNRECVATRESIGIMDATTLGKIDVQGPDSRKFLNMVYTNAWSKLEAGKCRYGLMLHEDGNVFDDGVTSCLGEDHFLMTTTSGNAAPVMAWLEEWLQTEWPAWQVRLTSVTEQFATMTVAGPNARRLLEEVGSDCDFSNEAFPYMAWREAKIAGVPARVFRISFTGEMSFEINVPASFGMAVWQALMTAGQKYAITPFGTEAMHVLRAEKGYIIIGQETDGSVTPVDLGMGWALSRQKDYLGRRGMLRSDLQREDRKQLVGLLTENPKDVLHEGGQLVFEPKPKPPMEMVGHVTSSYWSECLGHSIAMAVVKGGHHKKGEAVWCPMPSGKTVKATITDPVFYDPEGSRLHG